MLAGVHKHRSVVMLAMFMMSFGLTGWSEELRGELIDFEELTRFTGASGNSDGQPGGEFYNGDQGTGTNADGWSSQNFYFNNTYNGDFLPDFDFWDGWAYSNVVNSVSAGFQNQYAAFPGGGAGINGGTSPGSNYAIAFSDSAYIDIPDGQYVEMLSIANTTYAAIAMRDGDGFSKKFGGATGDDPDFFRVVFTGYSETGKSGNTLGNVRFELADFTFDDNELDYIVSGWEQLALADLRGARSIGIHFESSDVGEFGINTPVYVAVDSIQYSAVPEPSHALLAMPLSLACGFVAWRRRRSR